MKTFAARLCAVLGTVALYLSGAAAHAHKLQVEPVVVVIRPQKDYLSAEFVGNIQDITQSVSAEDKDERGDRFTPEVNKRVEDYFNERFLLSQGNVTFKATLTSLTHDSGLDPTQAKFHLFLRYPRPANADPKAPYTIKTTLLDYLPNAAIVLSLSGLSKTMHPGDTVTLDPNAFVSNLLINIRQFTLLGMEHIFTGPDHMLFILALLLVSVNFKQLVKTLTGFTVAHSITLVLSALSVIVLPARLTDVLVAVSIVYVGLENIFLKSTKHRFWIASAFGLVHGFGFSGVLREIGLPSGMAQFWCLLSFNLGVEIAQVILCGIAFPLLMLWRRQTEERARFGGMPWETVTKMASIGVVIAGGYWLIERAFGS